MLFHLYSMHGFNPNQRQQQQGRLGLRLPGIWSLCQHKIQVCPELCNQNLHQEHCSTQDSPKLPYLESSTSPQHHLKEENFKDNSYSSYHALLQCLLSCFSSDSWGVDRILVNIFNEGMAPQKEAAHIDMAPPHEMTTKAIVTFFE